MVLGVDFVDSFDLRVFRGGYFRFRYACKVFGCFLGLSFKFEVVVNVIGGFLVVLCWSVCVLMVRIGLGCGSYSSGWVPRLEVCKFDLRNWMLGCIFVARSFDLYISSAKLIITY